LIRDKAKLLEEEEAQNQATIAQAAIQKQIKKQEREREVVEKREMRARQTYEKANEKACLQALKDHNRLFKGLEELAIIDAQPSRPRKKAKQKRQVKPSSGDTSQGVVVAETRLTTSGRRTKLPTRFIK
jgi:hypothetical protein